ncbi:MAG: hypothetical protein PHI97_18310 [Desulfobulbus sp.]|nr:hypothetical protein [Desulfobulbus sp.]
MKHKIHILFPSEWAAYSPTLLNLAEVLGKDCEVVVTCFDNGKYNNSSLDPVLFKIERLPYAMFALLAALGLYGTYKKAMLRYAIRREGADVLIGVDNLGLAAVLECAPKAHFLSLEISRSALFNRLDWGRVASVAIQTQERLDYLFPARKPDNVFILPNSPRMSVGSPGCKPQDPDGIFNVVLLGNLIPSHGLYICIDAVAAMERVVLTLKGNLSDNVRHNIEVSYGSLLGSKRLLIDDSYTPQDRLIPYLSRFDAGFCFYDFNQLKRDFNYQSSPSGKMYAYLAAGVPTIGSDIVGLNPIRKFDAGILLHEHSSAKICAAIDTLRQRHARYRQGCLQAARNFDFDAHAKPYKKYLLEAMANAS